MKRDILNLKYPLSNRKKIENVSLHLIKSISSALVLKYRFNMNLY